MIIYERGVHKGIGEQRDAFKINYLEVLEAELSRRKTNI